MVVLSIPIHAKFGRNDHREDATHFILFIETENTPATSTPRSHLTREVSFDRDFPEYPSTPNLKREKALVITSPDLDMIQEASEGSAYGLSRSNTGTTPKSDRIGIQI